MRKATSFWALLSFCSIAIAVLSVTGIPNAAARSGPSVFVQDRQDEGQQRVAPRDLKPGQRCVECHEDLIAPTKVHAPVSDERCELCHPLAAPTRHIFLDLEDPAGPCIECHELPERPVVHKPVEERKCLMCHVPHHSKKRYLLRKETEKELCVECHEPQAGVDQKHVHGPVALGTCMLCHSPHSTRAPKLLKTVGAIGCLDCHMEMQDELTAAKTVHPPVTENCALCHDPHASNNRFQLKSEPKALCLTCHQAMVDELQKKPFPHAALTKDDGCENCHDVHSSSLPALLKSSVKDACLSCHDAPIPRDDGTHFPGIGDLLRNSAFLHGPIREGNCEACHDPHGSSTFSLLRDPYPMRFYSPFATELYTLCFRCHDADVFTTEKTRRLTHFRDGNNNLHFLHVNKDKGRTCRTCHETHGSNLPNHISTSVPFGSWDVPINFVKNETGGTCSPGCHEPRTYDYRSTEDYRQ